MSLSGTELKNLRSLHTKKGRRADRMFLAEGIRLLEESERHSVYPKNVYYAPSLLTKRGERLIARLGNKSASLYEISARQTGMISDTKAPQGIIGLFAIPETKLVKLYIPDNRNILLCENTSDPGNLGTLLRSALAFGFELVLVCGSTADPFSPKVVRSSAGALFGLKIAVVAPAELQQFVRKERIMMLATDTEGHRWQTSYSRICKAERRLLAVGSEATGLSKGMLNMADITIRIDHSSKVESLNAAVAGSILLKNIYDCNRR